MPYKPIEDYGAIGNLCTTALVAINGDIDFFCFPNFDSPTVFAAVLDEEQGGSFSLRPTGPEFAFRQMYESESNVLLTRFLSADAVAELTDFMPVTETTQRNSIVRYLKVIHGTVTFRLACHPSFDYNRSKHHLHVHSDRIVFEPENQAIGKMQLLSTVPLRDDGTAEFTLNEDETACFVFGAEGDDHCLTCQEGADELNETIVYWRKWIGKSTYTGRWRETVNRSALTLKLLSSRKHGSILAAATFGLPEQIGGGRNWDYRFIWIRDAAFTIYAYMRLGLRSEADEFFSWIRQQISQSSNPNQPMQIMYGIDGRTELPECEVPLKGYRQSGPVRIGNNAYGQLQLDIYGELFDAVYLYSKYGHPVPHDGWTRIRNILDWLGKNWEQPDEGIWEVRGGRQHFLHSRLMCWVAFDRAIRLAHKRSLSAPLVEWYGNRDRIVEDIYTNFWNEELKAFTQHRGTKAMDAAVLLMPLLRFISPVDPRWLSTLDAIERELGEDFLVYRYRMGDGLDGLLGEEGSFTACGFWLVECQARAGRLEKARRNFEKLLASSNHLGLYSEQLGRDGHHLGNFPQAFSHLALISAAFALDRALSNKPPAAWS